MNNISEERELECVPVPRIWVCPHQRSNLVECLGFFLRYQSVDVAECIRKTHKALHGLLEIMERSTIDMALSVNIGDLKVVN